jgi:hypothetical protein
MLALIQQSQVYTPPTFFAPVVIGLLVLGAIGWVVAAIIGLTRVRIYGPATKWFALAAILLVVYHLQFLVLAFGLIRNSTDVMNLGAFFNLSVALAAVCAILGFTRLSNLEK